MEGVVGENLEGSDRLEEYFLFIIFAYIFSLRERYVFGYEECWDCIFEGILGEIVRFLEDCVDGVSIDLRVEEFDNFKAEEVVLEVLLSE